MKSLQLQWRALLSVEVVLVLLVLIMAGAVLYQAQQTAGLRTERAAVEAKAAQARESLAALQDPAVLQKQLQELKASPQGQKLPTRRDALALSPSLANYAAQSGLLIVALNTGEGTIPGAGEGETVPTVMVSLEVEGPLARLVGLFSTVDGFPSARVQLLEFSPGSDGVWHAKLELAVAYGP